MFKRPLIFSTILLALAHGSNEVNVSAPCAAMLFLLNSNKSEITNKEAFIGMTIGLVTQLFGFITLGKLYLRKKRSSFMKISYVNGFIVNTTSSLILLICSFYGFPLSCGQLVVSQLYVLKQKDLGKPINK
mmetsp:Transcript_25314/g.24698  ORF Transcript_25314/g.24698 Transcript_25314/m.24698 type:complete len:131 (-) Transcript_25314:61-453(-)